jgi:all-trans-retinol 13,14-reductase
MGGLAFASILAKLRKWRVLMLERHFKIGGFTHTFTRPGGWSWDVGLDYVGAMGQGMVGRRLFDFITDGGVKWNPRPDVYQRGLAGPVRNHSHTNELLDASLERSVYSVADNR